ncbi:bifunctional metallophosphatase/5'-nucleotidase [Desulfomarina profundi]|nr:5'-nucleotidase C-terminal domain-containing protein [Desulfomarina profundi]
MKKTTFYSLVFSCSLFFTGLFFSVSIADLSASPRSAAKQLTIIGTGDLQGRLDPVREFVPGMASRKTAVTGGISRIATLIKQIRQETQNPVIVLSSGDDLMGRYFHQFKGKAIFTLMEMAGYDILGLGNHDFDGGPGVLAEALESVSMIALCSDLQVEGTVMEKSCSPYLIRNYQGIRIGFFSLMTRNFPVITSTGKIKLSIDRKNTARKMVSLLRKKGARIIIAVTHTGNREDHKLAGETTGIDIIFGGHSHDYTATVEQTGDTLIVNGGEKGMALVRLDVNLDSSGHIIPDSAKYTLLPVSASIAPEKRVADTLKHYRDQLPKAAIIGNTLKNWDLTKTALRTGESPVADLVTDTIRTRFNADIVLFNSGAFRGNTSYPAGPVTDTMIAEIDEFENDIILLTIKGKHLLQILETSAGKLGTGGFLQVSGIRLSISPASPANADSSRIKSIKTVDPDGSLHPLDPERDYLLATNDFLALHGGDGYGQFRQYGHDIRNTYSTMGSIMIDRFLREQTVSPAKPDGRITILRSKSQFNLHHDS